MNLAIFRIKSFPLPKKEQDWEKKNRKTMQSYGPQMVACPRTLKKSINRESWQERSICTLFHFPKKKFVKLDLHVSCTLAAYANTHFCRWLVQLLGFFMRSWQRSDFSAEATENKAVYTTTFVDKESKTFVAGGWAGAVMSWAGAVIIWAGAVIIWAGAVLIWAGACSNTNCP